MERCYFDSHLADGATVRSELLKGLEQAGDTTLPAVFLAKRLPPLLDLVGVDLPDLPTDPPTDPAPPGSAAAAPRRASAWPLREVQSSLGGAAEPPLEAPSPPWGSWLVGSEADLPQKPQIRLLAHPGLGAASGARPALLAAAGAASASAGGALGLGLGAAGGPAAAKPPRVLLAVGPEGGWTPFELRLLQVSGR